MKELIIYSVSNGFNHWTDSKITTHGWFDIVINGKKGTLYAQHDMSDMIYKFHGVNQRETNIEI